MLERSFCGGVSEFIDNVTLWVMCLTQILPSLVSIWIRTLARRGAYKLLALTATFFWVLSYANDNDSTPYVPKSQRNKYVQWMKSWLKDKTNKLETKLQHWQHRQAMRSRYRHRERLLQGKYRQHLSKPSRWKRMFLILFLFGATAAHAKTPTRRHQVTAYQALLAQQARDEAQAHGAATFDTDSAQVGIDNRCSACITHVIDDFETPPQPTNRVIKGFGGSRTTNVMVGTLRWSFEDDDGKVHTFRIPNSYYVKDGGIRLLSPQHWAKSQANRKGTGEETLWDRCTLFWNNRRYLRSIPLSPGSNVATIHLASGYQKYHAFCAEANIPEDEVEDPITFDTGVVSDDEEDDSIEEDQTTFEEENQPAASSDSLDRHQSPRKFDLDLHATPESSPDEPAVVVIDDEEDRQPSNTASEFLKYHIKYGHCSTKRIQAMARNGELPRRLAKCDVPVCSACQFGKATKRPWRPKTSSNKDDAAKPTRPGQVVSVDQMESRTPGLIAQMSGFLTKKRYTIATVFVDHYSNIGFVHLQTSPGAKETVEAKEACERYFAQYGIKIDHYHADNGIFTAKEWIEDCYSKGQGLTFASVNAHHQNGRAEVRIRHLQEQARTMLIHANKRWPEAINANLWPYAVRMANDSINNTPWINDKHGRSPVELLTGSKSTIKPKHWFHFGCPVYVLDSELQKGQRRPKGGKWKDRSRIGIYLGRSPVHRPNVALVLNLQTARVSPQFHVRIDSMFHTVKNATRQVRTISRWQEVAGFTGSTAATDDQPTNNSNSKEKTKAQAAPEASVIPPAEYLHPIPQGTQQADGENSWLSGSEGASAHSNPTQASEGAPEAPQQSSAEETSSSRTSSEPQRQDTPSLRRSSRPRTAPERLIEAMQTELEDQDIPFELFSLQAMFPDSAYSTDENALLAFKATSDPDTMYLHEAMREHDRDEFKKAMRKEIDSQLESGTLVLVKAKNVPQGATVLPAVWQMKRKRHIMTRKVYKWKARLNIDGSRQVYQRDYDETYAPVATWKSIRLLLILVLIHSWHTVQLDYVLAYTQAPVEREMYMKIPRGFEIKGADRDEYLLQVKRNVYGQKQAGRVFNQYLVKGLTELGFKQSKIDDCVFYKGRMVYVLYTDDSILAGPDKQEIDETIKLMNDKFDITVEGSLSDFLGINIDRRDDGTIHLTQPHLIDQLIKEDLKFRENTNEKAIPMKSSELLSRHPDSPHHDDSFHYRSVIGKLNYLEKGSRPDIAYATHQCARFASSPRQEHSKAVRWIVKYLKATRDKGMIYKPDLSKSFEVFVDSDFSGNWDRSIAHNDPDTARSRHGYIITYAGCPIIWKSQLQTEIALSSTEAEYTGLSYALREAIPVMELLKEMKEHGFDVLDHRPKVHCKVFEDNSGALEIAKVHKARPRTKHINVKLHHFRSYVTSGAITIHPIRTDDQPADYLTKPLNEPTHVKHRKTVQGW